MAQASVPQETGMTLGAGVRKADSPEVASLEPRIDSPVRQVFRRFLRNRLAVVGALVLIVITFSAVAAPLLTPHTPTSVNLRSLRRPPSEAHILGTDPAGRDVFARVVYGGRVSLSVGIFSVIIYTAVGIVLGLVSGYYGRWVDAIIMRITDTMMSLPPLLVMLMLVTITTPSIGTLIMAVAVTRWPGIVRVVRGQVLSVKEMEYVTAAHALGVPPRRIMFWHLLPNVFSPVIVSATFGLAQAIMAEASLSFLGLGVQPPTPSWGNMLNDAQSISILTSMPWYWVPPGLLIAISVLSINFVGDGLRDALDPRSKKI